MLLAAQVLVWLLTIYATIGVMFALPFVVRGVDLVDPAARGSSWGFRVLIVPGAAALWPLLACRWWHRRGEAPTSRAAGER